MASLATTGFQFVMAPCGGITAIGDETPETLIDRVLDVTRPRILEAVGFCDTRSED